MKITNLILKRRIHRISWCLNIKRYVMYMCIFFHLKVDNLRILFLKPTSSIFLSNNNVIVNTFFFLDHYYPVTHLQGRIGLPLPRWQIFRAEKFFQYIDWYLFAFLRKWMGEFCSQERRSHWSFPGRKVLVAPSYYVYVFLVVVY